MEAKVPGSYAGADPSLGNHLSKGVKEKIWKGEFIDLFTLLFREKQMEERGQKGQKRQGQTLQT